jgi:hypothetical protein
MRKIPQITELPLEVMKSLVADSGRKTAKECTNQTHGAGNQHWKTSPTGSKIFNRNTY